MKEVLLRTARTLKQPGDASIKEFGAQWETLAAQGTQIFRMRPDVDRLIGRGNDRRQVGPVAGGYGYHEPEKSGSSAYGK
jgi:hypothetical protein